MFFETQSTIHQKSYEDYLGIVGSLSNLFSDSEVPYLYYRIAEKIFCRSFEAEDLSRSDLSADAKYGDLGIGLKTFLANNHKTMQKISEFNAEKHIYENLPTKQKIQKISQLRNSRLQMTNNTYNLKDTIYHCVIREKGKFLIHEENMCQIDINSIGNIKTNKGSISFSDGIHDYGFLTSKSTLTKRFITNNILGEFNVRIIDDPLNHLKEILSQYSSIQKKDIHITDTIYLPLYGKNYKVYSNSGLNQWNANGRVRNISEVYIPVPSIVHKINPLFFPNRNTSFDLRLPNGKIMQSKICQEGGKALMSYSNKELGQWILRDVLHLNEGDLLTISKLEEIGIDSVRIDKLSNGDFEINFSYIGSYENFISGNLIE